MGMQVIGFLIFNQIGNSYIVYRRDYSLSKKVLLIFLLTFAIFAYSLNSKISEREQNFYDSVSIQRKGYSQDDVKYLIKETKASNSYKALSPQEKRFIEAKFKTIQEPGYNRYYELVNKFYEEKVDQDGQILDNQRYGIQSRIIKLTIA